MKRDGKGWKVTSLSSSCFHGNRLSLFIMELTTSQTPYQTVHNKSGLSFNELSWKTSLPNRITRNRILPKPKPHYAGGICKRRFHSEIFSVQTKQEKFEKTVITGHLCLKKARAGKSHDHRNVIAFEKLPSQNVFRPH